MIPIKIFCGCGQKYSFDVEPIGESIGYAVQCPACGADATAAANQMIAQHLAAQRGEDALRKRPRNVRAGWLLLAIGGGVVVVLALAGAVLFGRSHGQKHEPANSVAMAKDGLPCTLGELNAW